VGQGAIENVRIEILPNGRPLYIFDGKGDAPGVDIPGSLIVPSPEGQPFKVPVLWKKLPSAIKKPEIFNPVLHAKRPLDPLKEDDIDKAYWWFFTPHKPRILVEWHPAFHAIPEPVLGAIPEPEGIDPILYFDARVPQYNLPNFWAKPFEPFGCTCMSYYRRPYTVLNYRVPETYLLVIYDIALDICDQEDTTLSFGDTVQIDILRDGARIASFEDTVLDPANPDPAKRWAFTSTTQKVPIWMRFDRNQIMTIQLTNLGAFPFQKTNQDTFCGSLGIIPHGYLGSLMDNRDGTARPIDVGPMRDYFGVDALSESGIIADMESRMALYEEWMQESMGWVK